VTPPPDDILKTPLPDGPQNVGNISIADHDLLVRIYERQRAENERLDAMSSQIAAVDAKFDTLDTKYVTRMEFWPVKTIVYAGAGVILLAVVGALVAMVVISRDAVRSVEGHPGGSGVMQVGR
jgi:hypothetical protein